MSEEDFRKMIQFEPQVRVCVKVRFTGNEVEKMAECIDLIEGKRIA